MSEIINNYAEGSCTFQAGSSQNGDVHISNCEIHQGFKPKAEAELGKENIGSPINLSRNAKKIDLIRVMNAWYECGKVVDVNGQKIEKKVFFEWVGKLFNTDLSQYHKNLSNTTSASTTEETQLEIFDELRNKQKEFNDRKLSK